MYRTGHYGISMMLYSPVAFVLLLFHQFVLTVLGFFIVMFYAPFPDIDLKIPRVKHRGPTHTVWFSILMGIITGIVMYGFFHYYESFSFFPQAEYSAAIFGVFSFVMGTIGILSHIAGDAITPMGIKPFTPFNNKKYTLDLVKAANDSANYGFWALGLFSLALSVIVSLRFF